MRFLWALLRAMLVGVRKAVLRDMRACISTQLLVILGSVMMVVIVVRQMQGPMDMVIEEQIVRPKDMFATMTPQDTELEGRMHECHCHNY